MYLVNNRNYDVRTERLGLRNWITSDVIPFIKMCKDELVMEHFPKPLSDDEALALINRFKAHYDTYKYCYFAVDILETGEFIGFTGFAHQAWKSKFTPCVDIGWRLKKEAWGKGYATEAAKGCLDIASCEFGLSEVLSFATNTNTASENVMKKIGMEYVGNVQHPAIINDPRFKHCVVYSWKHL